MYKLSKKSISKLNGVHPKLSNVIKEAIKDSEIDFSVIWGVRTKEEQIELYKQGRETKGIIVTWRDGIKKKSNHQIKEDGYGWAIDICPYIEGKLKWNDIKAFDKIISHIKKTAKKQGVKIVCGIDWKKIDRPHVELATT